MTLLPLWSEGLEVCPFSLGFPRWLRCIPEVWEFLAVSQPPVTICFAPGRSLKGPCLEHCLQCVRMCFIFQWVDRKLPVLVREALLRCRADSGATIKGIGARPRPGRGAVRFPRVQPLPAPISNWHSDGLVCKVCVDPNGSDRSTLVITPGSLCDCVFY